MYERDQMYPAFIREAKASTNSQAIRAFTYALKTEAEHFRLYAEALTNLDKMRGKSRMCYVCGVCGYATENLNFLRCLCAESPRTDTRRSARADPGNGQVGISTSADFQNHQREPYL